MVSTPHREDISPPVEPQVDPHTLAQMGIAMLIDLAQRGEINPWDVSVIDAIDLHLSKLPLQADATLAHKQANLSQSGQAFLWAAMLIFLNKVKVFGLGLTLLQTLSFEQHQHRCPQKCLS